MRTGHTGMSWRLTCGRWTSPNTVTGGIDLLTGGLPLTPFSTVGQKKGQHDKNDLMREGVRVVREIMPKAFR